MRYFGLLWPWALFAADLLEFHLANCQLFFSQEVEWVEVSQNMVLVNGKSITIPCGNSGEFFWYRAGQKVGYFCYGINSSEKWEEAIRLSLWKGPCLPQAENRSKWYKERSECFGEKTKLAYCYYEYSPNFLETPKSLKDKNVLTLEEIHPQDLLAIYNSSGMRISPTELNRLPKGLYFLELKNGKRKLLWRE